MNATIGASVRVDTSGLRRDEGNMSIPRMDEGGWPYEDGEASPEEAMLTLSEGAVGASNPVSEDPWDEDAMALHAYEPHLFDDLDPVEQAAVTARFGIGGAPVRSLREVSRQLGLPHQQVRAAMGSGLAKIRSHLLA